MLTKSLEVIHNAVDKFAKQPRKENAYKILCSSRTAGVRAITEYVKIKEMYHAEERRKSKAAEVLPENIRIKIPNTFDRDLKSCKEIMKNIGEIMFLTLGEWQELGGTFKELCMLCNISESKGTQEIGSLKECEKDFNKIIFIHNLDYKEKGDFLIDTPNAPFTLCIKEYMLDIMLNTARGRKASHEALKAVFPEIWEDAVILPMSDDGFQYTDEYGETHYIDKDGVEI